MEVRPRIKLVAAIAFFWFALPNLANANDVILSAGLGGYDAKQLQNLRNSFNAYSDMGIVSSASILIYEIDQNGQLGLYNTSDPNLSGERFQQILKTDVGLQAYPCIYCDETIGMCSKLHERLEKLYTHKSEFIKSTLNRAKEYGWDGYTVDFEIASGVDPQNLTNFVLEWSNALYHHNLKLYVWVGPCTVYNMTKLYNVLNPNLIILTMQTYCSSYSEFVSAANQQVIAINDVKRLGFGLITNPELRWLRPIRMTEEDMNRIVEWTCVTNADSLSIWATHIPPSWYVSLSKYSS